MNKDEFYTQWIAALRSHEYNQGVSRLRMLDRFCCLGVACDILVKNGKGHWTDNYYHTGKAAYFAEGETWASTAVLPESVADWLGMSDDGQFERLSSHGAYPTSDALTDLNDDGLTFPQIADVIEYFFAPKSL